MNDLLCFMIVAFLGIFIYISDIGEVISKTSKEEITFSISYSLRQQGITGMFFFQRGRRGRVVRAARLRRKA